MRVSDFAIRLRQAEIAQRKEDEAKAQVGWKESVGGAKAVTGPGELLKRRAEEETERREGLNRDRSEKDQPTDS